MKFFCKSRDMTISKENMAHCQITKESFPSTFLQQFVPNTPIKQLKKLHCYPKRGYLWNICGHNLVAYKEGAQAMAAYDQADKAGAMEMQYDNGFYGDDIPAPLSGEYDTSSKIKESGIREFYVIGKDFSWCYIVTHEPEGCGPYFIMK